MRFDSATIHIRPRALIGAPILGAALALAVIAGTGARPVAVAGPSRPVAPAQATQATLTVTGVLVDGDGTCSANWKIRRCGDNVLVPVRSDMNITAFRGSLVRVQGLPTSCPQLGQLLWLSSIEPVSDCAPPPPTAVPTATPQPGPNLALNRPVIASAGDPATVPEAVVDGNPATGWLADGSSAWLRVDLGQFRTFNRMRVTWGAPHALRYGIFVWEYDKWEFKYEVDGGDGGVDEFVIPRLYGRYVILSAVESSAPAGGFALNEWEIFGQETANLAFGQRVDVSDFQACCPGYLANDARYNTGWQSEVRPVLGEGEPTPPPPARNPWLRIILPTGSSVVELRALWDNVAYPWNYRIVFYEGQSTRALQVRSQRGGQHLISWPLPVRADAVLVYTEMLPKPVNFVALAELELFGPATAGGMQDHPLLNLAPPVAQGVTWEWLPTTSTRGRIGLPEPIKPRGSAAIGQPAVAGAPSSFPRPDAPAPDDASGQR